MTLVEQQGHDNARVSTKVYRRTLGRKVRNPYLYDGGGCSRLSTFLHNVTSFAWHFSKPSITSDPETLLVDRARLVNLLPLYIRFPMSSVNVGDALLTLRVVNCKKDAAVKDPQ